jgi:hypothetical protein
MGLKPQFTQGDIKAFINKKLKGYQDAIELRLRRTGEEFIVLTKENGTYKDRTGNLRNAPFYIVTLNGVRLASKYGNGKVAAESRAFAEKVSGNYKKGYALICGDGMEYAAKVESLGKEVITGSTQIIEVRLREALLRIQNKVNGA